jgi:hypothetical protein
VPDYRSKRFLYRGEREGAGFCASSSATARIRELSAHRIHMPGVTVDKIRWLTHLKVASISEDRLL